MPLSHLVDLFGRQRIMTEMSSLILLLKVHVMIKMHDSYTGFSFPNKVEVD